jgi:hypothetical protein
MYPESRQRYPQERRKKKTVAKSPFHECILRTKDLDNVEEK